MHAFVILFVRRHLLHRRRASWMRWTTATREANGRRTHERTHAARELMTLSAMRRAACVRNYAQMQTRTTRKITRTQVAHVRRSIVVPSLGESLCGFSFYMILIRRGPIGRPSHVGSIMMILNTHLLHHPWAGSSSTSSLAAIARSQTIFGDVERRKAAEDFSRTFRGLPNVLRTDYARDGIVRPPTNARTIIWRTSQKTRSSASNAISWMCTCAYVCAVVDCVCCSLALTAVDRTSVIA